MTPGIRIAACLSGLAVIALGFNLVEVAVLLAFAVASIIAWEMSE